MIYIRLKSFKSYAPTNIEQYPWWMWHGCQLSQLCLVIGNESRAWWWNFNHQVYYIANITIYWACLVPVFAYAHGRMCVIHITSGMIMHPQVTWQCIFPVADVITQKHANIFPSISQSVNCVNCICCVSSISDVEFLWCEILWIESLLEMLLHCHSPARALVCKHVSLTNDLRQLCHLRHLDICRSMFCLDVSRRGCSASTSSIIRSWWVHYCESIQWTQVQAAIVQFLNRGHVWVVAMLAQNLQDLLHHSFWSIGGSVNFVISCQLCHLLAMSVPVADGSLPMMVLAPSIIQEAGFIDWSVFWVVCPDII